jgi:pimeloyl-ACP methyl ester carboxylesterase
MTNDRSPRCESVPSCRREAARDAMEGELMAKRLVNGITIAYDDVGEGGNVLVLVHGHPFNRTMWQPQMGWIGPFNRARPRARFEGGGADALTGLERFGGEIGIEPAAQNLEHEHDGRRRWRAIVPDLRGYGGSTVVPGKTTLDIFARDIAGLLDELGIQDVVIGGLSMGGQIVMEFCRLYPERVRGILLAATFCRAETEQGKRQRVAMADRLLKEGMEPYAEEVLPKMVTPANLIALPQVADHVRSMMRTTHPTGAAAAIRGRAERPDYEETLARVEVPALVVVGDEDAFTTRADAEQMSNVLKRSELVWVKGGGHMPNLEREAEFNEALGRLLERCADDGRSADDR